MIRIFLIVFQIAFFTCAASAQVSNLEARAPQHSIEIEENAATNIDINQIPNFQNFYKQAFQQNKLNSEKAIQVDSRIRMKLETPILIKDAKVGDYFRATIVDDIYLSDQKQQLVGVNGSWVRGVITYIKKPTLFNGVGKVIVLIDQITSPTGVIIPVNASLDFKQGVFDQSGHYIPSFAGNSYPLQEINTFQNTKIDVDDINELLIGKLMRGTLDTVFIENNKFNFFVGQELQIILNASINISAN